MSTENETPDEVVVAAPAPVSKEKVMCYVSKQLVPVSETVEVHYSADKKYRVLPKFVKY
jgi:hypothetical protein